MLSGYAHLTSTCDIDCSSLISYFLTAFIRSLMDAICYVYFAMWSLRSETTFLTSGFRVLTCLLEFDKLAAGEKSPFFIL